MVSSVLPDLEIIIFKVFFGFFINLFFVSILLKKINFFLFLEPIKSYIALEPKDDPPIP